MLYTLISILIVMIPVVGLVSGLSVAVTVPIFLLLILLALRDHILVNLKYIIFKNSLLTKWKLELAFSLWCFIASFYSYNYPNSLLVYGQTFSIALIGFIIHSNIKNLSINIAPIKMYFIVGMLLAISIFFIEYSSYGVVTRSFRFIFQPQTTNQFFLFALDRGCALLSVFSWVVIAILIQYHKYLVALIYYLLIIFLLSTSDSLASLVAFIIGSVAFLINRLSITKSLQVIFWKLFTVSVLTGSILMPVISYNMKPNEVSNNYSKFLPSSAKHRLFIWHFVAKKVAKKSIIGYGFSASKYYKVNEDEIITYNHSLWSPLPLHPHNNIMQVLFETGLIGFLLFLSLISKYIKQIANITLLSSPTNSTSKTKTVIYRKQHIDSKILNYSAVSYAIFVNYYIIGMISFSIWQTWWVCTIWGAIVSLQLLAQATMD